MATRESRLRLIIDSSDAQKAARDLDRFGDEAKGAENSTKRLEDRINRAGREFADFGRGVARIGAIATGVFSGLAVIAGGISFARAIKEAQDAEAAIAQVRQGIESTGGVAKRTEQEIINLTSRLQNASLFPDEQLQAAAANLLTFTNVVGENFDRALGSIADVSQRVGQDLVSTTIQLGKALNDPVANLGALSRTGIQFSDSQKEVIKALAETNRLADAQSIILSELEKQYGGSARAARDTFAGAVRASQNAFSDFLEVLGGPSIRESTDELNDLAGLLSDPRTIENAAKLGEAIADGLEIAIRALQSFVNQFNAFVEYLNRQGFLPDVELKLRLNDEELTQDALRAKTLTEREIGKITLGLDEASVKAVQQRIEQLDADIGRLSLLSKDDIASLAELGSAQTELDNLRAILERASVIMPKLREGAEGTGEAFSAANDNVKDLSDSIDLTAIAIGKLADKAEKARTSLNFDIGKSLISDALSPFENTRGGTINGDGEFIRAFRETVDGLKETINDFEEIKLITPQQAQELRDTLFDGAAEISDGIVEGSERGAKIFADRASAALANSFGNILDDILFNSGENFGRILKDASRDFANDNFINPLSDALAGRGSFDDIGKSLKASADAFGRAGKSVASAIDSSLAKAGEVIGKGLNAALAGFAGFEIGKSISSLLGIEGNKKSVAAGGALGGLAGLGGGLAISGGLGAVAGIATGGSLAAAGAALGSVVPIVGTIIGAALGAVLGGLFSKPSANAAGVQFDLETGKIAGQFAKNNDPANIEARDALRDATLQVTQALSQLTGGNFGGQDIAFTVGNRGTRITSGNQDVTTPFGDSDAAFNEILRQALLLLKDGEKDLVAFAKGALAAGRSAEDTLNVLEALSSAFDTGKKALSDYALIAAKAGRSAQEISEGVSALDKVFGLVEKPLSNVEAALKNIDDTVKPVIEDLRGLGQSIAEISKISKEAARAVGQDFINGIQDDIAQFQQSTLADFRKILKSQEGILKDAQALADRGAITPDEFRLVQVRNSLEQQRFFENLSPDELQNLGDYLGLVDSAGGQIAVVLLEIQQAFTDFVDNVKETRERLRREAEAIQASVGRAETARDAVLRQFSPLRPTEQLGDLQGQLQNLLNLAKGAPENVNADLIDKATNLFRDVVNLSAQIKGPTTGFAEDRDQALNIIDQIISIGDKAAAEKFSLEESAQQQVTILQGIRDAIESPDPALDIIQSQLDAGYVTNDLLKQLLQQFVELSRIQFENLSPSVVQGAATAAVSQQVSISGPVTVDFGAVVVSLNDFKKAQAAEQAATRRVLEEIRDNQRQATGTRSSTL